MGTDAEQRLRGWSEFPRAKIVATPVLFTAADFAACLAGADALALLKALPEWPVSNDPYADNRGRCVWCGNFENEGHEDGSDGEPICYFIKINELLQRLTSAEGQG
jgi:hypothetical protein